MQSELQVYTVSARDTCEKIGDDGGEGEGLEKDRTYWRRHLARERLFSRRHRIGRPRGRARHGFDCRGSVGSLCLPRCVYFSSLSRWFSFPDNVAIRRVTPSAPGRSSFFNFRASVAESHPSLLANFLRACIAYGGAATLRGSSFILFTIGNVVISFWNNNA